MNKHERKLKAFNKLKKSSRYRLALDDYYLVSWRSGNIDSQTYDYYLKGQYEYVLKTINSGTKYTTNYWKRNYYKNGWRGLTKQELINKRDWEKMKNGNIDI